MRQPFNPSWFFWVRPEIRSYTTYAWWCDTESNAFLDDSAGIDPDDTSDLT
jgi:maltoporin